MSASAGILSGYRGHIDAVEPALSGWVSEIARPSVPVGCVLSIDAAAPIPLTADRARPDVAAAGLGGPNCGFAVDLPPRVLDGREHRLRLLLGDGRNLNLPGMPPSVALGAVTADVVGPGDVDLAAVLDLLRQNDFEAGSDPATVRPENAAAFNALAVPDHGFVFYARAGGRLVGYARLDRGRSEAAVLGVVALTVLAAYRRKGLGEALMRALLNAASATQSLHQVWLSVRPDNIPAIRLYDKLGFIANANRPPGSWAVPGETTMLWLPQRTA